MTPGSRFAQEAEALVGTSFRLHGRNPATGLDCVGLVASALSAMGRVPRAPRGYALRNGSIASYLGLAEANGFQAIDGPIARGDLLLVRPGPSQHHLMIATGLREFVHAHASLRRVVIHRGALPWPRCGHWRLTSTIEE